MKRKFRNLLTSAIFAVCLSAGFAGLAGNMDATNKYAWSANTGWTNMETASGSVTVYDTYLSGYAWNENTGWIKLGNDAGGPYNNTNATDWGVNNDGNGNLSGYAWSSNTGWINFSTAQSQVKIDTSGNFSGCAWNENTGWIHFANSGAVTYKVKTSWCPSYTVTAASAGNGTVLPVTQIVTHGANAAAITATSSPNYRFVQWNDGNIVNPRTLTNITADQTITATFAENILTVTLDTSSISENGGMATGTATRNSGMSGNLTVTLSSDDTTEATVPASVIIPVGSNRADFTITAADDDIIDGTQSVTISVTAVNYTGDSVALDVTDDDTAGFTVTQTSLTVEEDHSDTFNVALTTEPDSDVVLTVVSDNTADVTVDSATLTFTPANWSASQMITVTAVDNATHGNSSSTITIAVDDANSDDNFDPVADQIVTVAVTDDEPVAVNDTASLTPSNSKVIYVLANDTDPQGDILSITAITVAPTQGTATITDAATTITYTAGPNSIDDSFKYRISDGNGGFDEATVTITVEEKITRGSIIKVDATDVTNMDAEFTRAPRIYGKYTDPVRLRALSSSARGITRIGATAQNNKFECEWSRVICLYNRRARLLANRNGDSTVKWISELPNGKIKNLDCALWAKATNLNRDRIDDAFRGVSIVCPTITDVTCWDGSALNVVHASSVLIIKGAYFGNRPPTVALEYPDPRTGAQRLQRLKILRPYKYSDSRGRIERSCMDLSSATGYSEIRVEMPRRWSTSMPPGNYDLILDNKIGLATYTSITTAITNTDDPTANDDAVTLICGNSSYYIDVLANDTDADADKMKIILEEDKTSTLGGRISVSKGKVRYTPPRGVLPGAFPDSFTYTLNDGNGGTSATPATVTVNMTAITLDPIKHWDGTPLSVGSRTVRPGSQIIISGTNLGIRVPRVTMSVEYGKIIKLRVVSKPQYADYKGNAKRSYTDVNSSSGTFGESEIVVDMPKITWNGYKNSKAYTITVRNRFDVGGADQMVTTAFSNPAQIAVADNVDLYSGEKCYYIDVLSNKATSSVSFSTDGVDLDSESDKLKILLESRTSDLGARLSVDRITNMVKYIRSRYDLCAFTDSFKYKLKDSTGTVSNTVTVTITGHVAP